MKYFVLFYFLLFSFALFASKSDSVIIVKINANEIGAMKIELSDSVSIKKEDKKVAAFFSFPLPLGFIGMHRIYMGAKPYVPLVYIATLGGCFGILPLIDFIVIVTHKDLEPYKNDKVFMWLK